MKLERLQTVQRLPVQIEEAWDFFTDPRNLRLITPPWLDVRVTSDVPEYLNPGALTCCVIRPFPGVSMKWISEVTHLRPPHYYVTEQRFGPFKLWHHEHHFRDHEDGVEVEDIVTYGLYLGPLGSLAHDFSVRKKLHEIFTFRARALEQQFGAVQRQPARSAPPSLQPQTPELRQQPRPQPQQRPQQSRPQPPQQQRPQPQTRPQPQQPSPQSAPTQERPITLEDIFKPEDD